MVREFEFNWFDGQIGLFNTLLDSYKGKDNLNFLEVGSFEGKSTCWCLDNILTGSDCKITCLDTWEGGFEHEDLTMSDIEARFLSNISDRKEDVEVLKGNSYDSLISLQDKIGHYDFIYIDGGHTLKDVISDLVLSFRLLKKGGIMAMDDYPWGSQEFPLDKRPQAAIDAFLIGWNEEIEIIHKQYQVWIRKK